MNAAKTQTIAYLGEDGSFTSLVARHHYGEEKTLVAQPTVADVVRFVEAEDDRIGVIPIQNLSGGIVYPTVDALASDRFSLVIQEEFGMTIRLAFLGRRGERIDSIFSHYVPLKHAEDWVRAKYPESRTHSVNSTSEAAAIAARTPHAAAIATRDAASRYGLEILEYPIREEVENFTQFFAVGHAGRTAECTDTSIVATLSDSSGSLFQFLRPFDEHKINLTRIQSQNVPGRLDVYKFFVSMSGVANQEPLRSALSEAEAIAHRLRVLGSYPRRLELYSS